MSIGLFDPCDSSFKSYRGGVPAGIPAGFFIRPGRGLSVSGARMIVKPDAGDRYAVEMKHMGIKNLKDVFFCEYIPPHAGLFWYYFELDMPEGTVCVCPGENNEGEIKTHRKANGSSRHMRRITRRPVGSRRPDLSHLPRQVLSEGDFPRNVPAGRILRRDWARCRNTGRMKTGKYSTTIISAAI